MDKLKQFMKEADFAQMSSMITTLLLALGVFYVGMAEIWGWPMPAEIMQTVKVVIALVSATLGVFAARQINSTIENKMKAEAYAAEILERSGYLKEADSDAKED